MTPPNPVTALERDPVCGMNVNPTSAKHVHEHAGKKYYFCCASCVEKFKTQPQQYLKNPSLSNLVMLETRAPTKSPPPLDPAKAHTLAIQPQSTLAGSGAPAYVCPMCPEVRESKPGACLPTENNGNAVEQCS